MSGARRVVIIESWTDGLHHCLAARPGGRRIVAPGAGRRARRAHQVRAHGRVLHESHGSHIFHTEDEELLRLPNSMTPFRPNRHRVDIVIEGRVLNWPILLSDIEAQSRSAAVIAQLEERRGEGTVLGCEFITGRRATPRSSFR